MSSQIPSESFYASLYLFLCWKAKRYRDLGFSDCYSVALLFFCEEHLSSCEMGLRPAFCMEPLGGGDTELLRLRCWHAGEPHKPGQEGK